MRIQVVGDGDTAKALRGLLAHAGLALAESFVDCIVEIKHSEQQHELILDTVQGRLEQDVFRHMRELTPTPIAISTSGPNKNDRRIRVIVGRDEADRRAVELGVLRGMIDFLQRSSPVIVGVDETERKPVKPGAFRRLLDFLRRSKLALWRRLERK